VSSLFLLNLERHEKSSKLRQRLEQKKEKKKDEGNIIIIKTDRLSLAFLSNRDGNSFFNWNDQKGIRKEKTSFFGGTKSHLSPQKK
jgi:hypothetical protein